MSRRDMVTAVCTIDTEQNPAYRPTPHRISLRLSAWLLRLPLKGGVIVWGYKPGT